MNSEFLKYCRENNENKIFCYIENVEEINYKRAMKFAIINENIKLIKYLLNCNVNLNERQIIKILEISIETVDFELFKIITKIDKYSSYDKYLHLIIDMYDFMEYLIDNDKFKDPFYVGKILSINTRFTPEENLNLLKKLSKENFDKIVKRYFYSSTNEHAQAFIKYIEKNEI